MRTLKTARKKNMKISIYAQIPLNRYVIHLLDEILLTFYQKHNITKLNDTKTRAERSETFVSEILDKLARIKKPDSGLLVMKATKTNLYLNAKSKLYPNIWLSLKDKRKLITGLHKYICKELESVLTDAAIIVRHNNRHMITEKTLDILGRDTGILVLQMEKNTTDSESDIDSSDTGEKVEDEEKTDEEDDEEKTDEEDDEEG